MSISAMVGYNYSDATTTPLSGTGLAWGIEMIFINRTASVLQLNRKHTKLRELSTVAINSMRVIYYGLGFLFCTQAGVVAQVPAMRDLGALGAYYSFLMATDIPEKVTGDVFSASHAVPNTTLDRTSGGNPAAGALGNALGLASDIGASRGLMVYAYRTHGAVEHNTLPGTTGRANTAPGTPGGDYRYVRDIDVNLWWAEPHSY